MAPDGPCQRRAAATTALSPSTWRSCVVWATASFTHTLDISACQCVVLSQLRGGCAPQKQAKHWRRSPAVSTCAPTNVALGMRVLSIGWACGLLDARSPQALPPTGWAFLRHPVNRGEDAPRAWSTRTRCTRRTRGACTTRGRTSHSEACWSSHAKVGGPRERPRGNEGGWAVARRRNARHPTGSVRFPGDLSSTCV
jgi:hypothetical protein